MLIAGIDGSSNLTGIAIFRDGQYIEHTLVDCHKIKDTDERLRQMMRGICKYLDEFDVDKIIMEKSVLKTNIAVVQLLSILSGAIMYYAAQRNIEFENPVPTEWRKRIGLEQSKNVKREVLKQEAILAVKREYGLSVSDDVAEAILIARSGFNLPKIEMHADDAEIDYWGN